MQYIVSSEYGSSMTVDLNIQTRDYPYESSVFDCNTKRVFFFLLSIHFIFENVAVSYLGTILFYCAIMFNFTLFLYNLVQEKDLKLRQGMKMMGLSVSNKEYLIHFEG